MVAVVRLALPAVVAGAVVFQEEADVASEVHALKDILEGNWKIARGVKGEKAKGRKG